MVDAGGEVDLGGLEGVIGREMDCQEKDASRVRRVTRSHNRRLPVEKIFANGTSRTRRGRVTAQVGEFLVDSLESHCFGWQGGVSEGEKKKRDSRLLPILRVVSFGLLAFALRGQGNPKDVEIDAWRTIRRRRKKKGGKRKGRKT